MNIKRTRSDKKWGCGCILKKDDLYLVGKRCKPGDLPQWCFIGGSIEIGETPIDAAYREVKEECNLTPIMMTCIGGYELNNVVDYVFLCESFVGESIPQEGELSELKWVTLKELEKMDLFPYTVKSIEYLKRYLERPTC